MEASTEKIREYIFKEFDNNVLPSLMDYIRIPNLSRNYDPEFKTNGLLEKAAQHIHDWIQTQNIQGIKLEIIKDEGRTPIIFAEIPSNCDSKETVVLYGYLIYIFTLTLQQVISINSLTSQDGEKGYRPLIQLFRMENYMVEEEQTMVMHHTHPSLL